MRHAVIFSFVLTSLLMLTTVAWSDESTPTGGCHCEGTVQGADHRGESVRGQGQDVRVRQ
jgi:hypothetical protein